MKWGWSNFNEVLKLFFLIIQKMLSGRKNGLSITEWLMIFLTLFPPLYYIDAIAKNFTTAVWSEMRRSISCFLYLLCVFYYTENLKWTKMLSFNSYKLKALYKNNFRKFSQNFLENTCDGASTCNFTQKLPYHIYFIRSFVEFSGHLLATVSEC